LSTSSVRPRAIIGMIYRFRGRYPSRLACRVPGKGWRVYLYRAKNFTLPIGLAHLLRLCNLALHASIRERKRRLKSLSMIRPRPTSSYSIHLLVSLNPLGNESWDTIHRHQGALAVLTASTSSPKLGSAKESCFKNSSFKRSTFNVQ